MAIASQAFASDDSVWTKDPSAWKVEIHPLQLWVPHLSTKVTLPDLPNRPSGTASSSRGIKDLHLVPNLSPQNLASVTIGKDFMLKHGYIKNDFDVQKWAAPEFLEAAAKELIEERWEKVTGDKLPKPVARIG